MGPDDLVIHNSKQLYDLSLEETIYRNDQKKLKGYMLHRSRKPKNPNKSITLVTDINKKRA